MAEGVAKKTAAASRTRSLAFVALTIAIMAVSAWITVPLGPVPFTLQMFAMVFAITLLTPGQCLAAVAGYLVLGAIGLPMFSAMRGGIGVLAGPTGGFLWGYLLGAAAAVLLLWLVRDKRAAGKRARAGSAPAQGASSATAAMAGADAGNRAAKARGSKARAFLRDGWVELLAGILFTAVSYLCGWLQIMAVLNLSPAAAFATALAPFIVVDLLKIIAAVVCAQAVRTAVGR